jgi:hypothetical protein
VSGDAEKRKSGVLKATLTLDCGGTFSDCFDGSDNLVSGLWGRVKLLVQTDCLPDAAPGARPTLSGGVAVPLEAEKFTDFIMVFGFNAQLTLKGFNIDCGGIRRGILAQTANLLTLDNMLISNCFVSCSGEGGRAR